jgi:cytochrome c oxidase subunit 2
MSKRWDSLALGVGVAIALILSVWMGQQAYHWMPPQATIEARHVDHIFSVLVALGTFVFLGVAGMMGWALLTCRAQPGDFSEGHPSRGSATLEILWTLGPTVLVIWIAIQSQHVYQLLDLQGLNTLADREAGAIAVSNPPANSVTAIAVHAKQWAWTFRYPNGVVSDQLHLPVNQPVQLVLESEEVLHGFYIPEFRVKQDIIPGHPIDFTITPQTTGTYRLQDSQFSGTYFALMQAEVYVESADTYQQWLSNAAVDVSALTSNAAVAEHTTPPQTLGRHWPTVAPKTPEPLYAHSPTQ